MATSFADFLAMISDTLSNRQGHELAYLLRPTSPHGKDLIKEFRNPTVWFFKFCAIQWLLCTDMQPYSETLWEGTRVP